VSDVTVYAEEKKKGGRSFKQVILPTNLHVAFLVDSIFQLVFLFSSLTVFRTVIMSKIHLAPRGQELGTIELGEEIP
jgi:hypothetical protein